MRRVIKRATTKIATYQDNEPAVIGYPTGDGACMIVYLDAKKADISVKRGRRMYQIVGLRETR